MLSRSETRSNARAACPAAPFVRHEQRKDVVDLSRRNAAAIVLHHHSDHSVGRRILNPNLDMPDPRLKAGIALSPFPPFGISPLVAYARITAPILHITGTEDRGFIIHHAIDNVLDRPLRLFKADRSSFAG